MRCWIILLSVATATAMWGQTVHRSGAAAGKAAPPSELVQLLRAVQQGTMKDGTIVFGDDTAKHEVSASLSWSTEPTPVRAELQYDGLYDGCHNHKTFRLQDLDPDSLIAFSEAAKAKGGYAFRVLTTNREKVVFMEKSGSECKENGERSSDFYVGNFWYTTATDRDKAAEAMKKAILLAGGKPSTPKPQTISASTNPAAQEALDFFVRKTNGLSRNIFPSDEDLYRYLKQVVKPGKTPCESIDIQVSSNDKDARSNYTLLPRDVQIDSIGDYSQEWRNTDGSTHALWFAVDIPLTIDNQTVHAHIWVDDPNIQKRVKLAIVSLAKACGAKTEAY